tara:strand:- start:59 stop:274 length:216 start_codon:yes stop_codon:yes gene_type:complete
MALKKCLVCGSSNLIADRALSGRLICSSCGRPYGVRKKGRKNLNDFNPFLNNNKYCLFLLIFFIAFLIVII